MIVASMMDQYAKFLKHTADYEWRKDFPSLNYILTSSGWRQDHNGFSHQNPGFIDDVLRRHGDFADVYFPADGNTTLVVMEHMLKSTKKINVVVAGKTLEPRWLTPELARKQLNDSVMTWNFASDNNPDVVLVGIGDYPTKEVLASISIAKSEWPEARLRCVNVNSLTSGGKSHGMGRCGDYVTEKEFNNQFTVDKPVVCIFHGYPETIKSILFNYNVNPSRFDIRGYIEQGSTTTPFDMHVRNKTSRYHIVIAIFEKLASADRIPKEIAQNIIMKYHDLIIENTEYIKQNGIDLPEIDKWTWNPGDDSQIQI